MSRSSYRRGRVFIAGDAAHECSPTGGIGMHTGLEEVVQPRLEARRHARRLGRRRRCSPPTRPSAGRSRCATSNSRRARTTPSPRIPGLATATATWPTGRLAAALAVDPRASQVAILLRGLADLRRRRHARRRGRDRRTSCPRPGPARARRMPGSPMAARRSTCSATVSCCCGSAPTRPMPAALLEAAKARGVPLRESRSPIRRSPRSTSASSCWCGRTATWPGAGDECPADAGAIIDRVRGARQHPRRPMRKPAAPCGASALEA